MLQLRADTSATVFVGPFVASADAVTRVTDINLSAANASTLLYKHNSEAGVDISGNTINHERMGYYTFQITTGNVDTEGRLSLFFGNTATHMDVWMDFMVMKANAYDALYGQTPTDYLKVDVRNFNATIEQPTTVPASNCAAASALGFLYSMLLNRTVTSSSLLTMMNYANTASVCSASLSDDGTEFIKKSFIAV